LYKRTVQHRDGLGHVFGLFVCVFDIGQVQVFHDRFHDNFRETAVPGFVVAFDYELHAGIVFVPQNQHANAHDRVGQQRSDGHHVDELFEIENRCHDA